MLTVVASTSTPFGRKVRIALDILGLNDQYTLQPANTQDPGDAIHGISPIGKIPALVLDDGTAIFDSREIIEYLDTVYGDGKIIPRETEARFRTLAAAALADGVMEALLLIVYAGRYKADDAEPNQVWIDHQLGKVRRGLAAILENLDDYQAPSIAAITLACVLGYADWRKQLDWRAEFPDLIPWLDNFAAEVPAFGQTPPGD